MIRNLPPTPLVLQSEVQSLQIPASVSVLLAEGSGGKDVSQQDRSEICYARFCQSAHDNRGNRHRLLLILASKRVRLQRILPNIRQQHLCRTLHNLHNRIRPRYRSSWDSCCRDSLQEPTRGKSETGVSRSEDQRFCRENASQRSYPRSAGGCSPDQ